MDDMQDDRRKLLNEMETARAKFELELKAIQNPVVGDVARKIEYC